MLLSLDWLSNYIDLSGLTSQEIVNQMVKCGFEVESVEKIGQGTNLIVGKIIECEKHPDSDHLHVTKVDIGNEILDIVCGAPNCRKGLKVIVAQVGAQLPAGTIKAGVIRGQASNGMLCSLKELGINEDMLKADSPSINGIEELDDSFEIGEKDILKKLGYDDTILDVSIYANRPDCLSMFAMAYEMGAILDRKVNLPYVAGTSNCGAPSNFSLKSSTKNCPHFIVKVIGKVTIKPSPEWLQRRLRSNGIKCINNLVDISNYVMLETGQPLHFYELRSNPNLNIDVRDDYQGEYTALDGITYKIEKGDLMITSDGKPIGIAGIMGGNNTKILEDTSGLIIEAALFDNAQIRRTSNRLGLQTEAASRFAKGLEPLAQIKAVDRACELLKELADAKDIQQNVEYGSSNYQPYEIVESLQHLNTLIGKEYTMPQVEKVLNRLDFEYRIEGDNFITIVPSRRASDLKIREDIDEEIVRLTNFDDLPSTLPITPQTLGKLSHDQSVRRDIKNYLVSQGIHEVINYTLVSKKDIEQGLLVAGEPVEMLSPLSDDRKYTRNSLLGSLLQTLSYNLDHYNQDVNIFEISKIYTCGKEEERLGLLLQGRLMDNKLKQLTLNADFYSLKGIVIGMLNNLGFSTSRIVIKENTQDCQHFHPYQSALVEMNNQLVAIFGKLHPVYLKNKKLTDVYYCELKLDVLTGFINEKIKVQTVNKFPAISRDISIVVNNDVKASDLLACIKKSGGKLVKQVKIFDIYQGEHVATDEKSISFNIVYQDTEKTLKNEDILPIQYKILKDLMEKFAGKQR